MEEASDVRRGGETDSEDEHDKAGYSRKEKVRIEIF